MLSSLPTKHSIAHVHWYLVSKTKTFLFGDHRKKNLCKFEAESQAEKLQKI